MPESRKRPGHPYHKPADIPTRQRVKGRIIWAVLLGILGLLLSFSAGGINYKIIVPSTLAGVFIGYFIGKKMEKKV
jgi:hypothetical protein